MHLEFNSEYDIPHTAIACCGDKPPESIMKTIITWGVLFLIVALGVFSFWLPILNPAQPVAIFVLLLAPIWMSGSCWIVKMAIDAAHKNNYKLVHFYLFSRGWFIFPLPKYSDIIRALRQLSQDRTTRPEGISSEISKYIVKDDFSEYVLSWEGKEKMMEMVSSGWISGGFFESPKPMKAFMQIVVVIAIVRGALGILNMVTHH